MSTANIVRLYLKNKPYIHEALESGIVNLSALSRLVQKELGIHDYFAVKAAVRRYYQHLGKVMANIETRALSVLKNNKITLLDGISIVATDKEVDIKNSAKVKIDSHYVYLTEKSELRKIRPKANVLRKYENCSAIVIHSEENIENVSGVMAFLTSVFAEQGINIIELISCYTETILVVSGENTLKSYELLSEIIK